MARRHLKSNGSNGPARKQILKRSSTQSGARNDAGMTRSIQRAVANPGTLTKKDVLNLQTTLGNQAVQRLLNGDHAGRRPKPGSTGRQQVVQRFPADPTTQEPINWAQEIVSVTKSGAGVQGVFFPVDNGGTKLVIKPEFADAARPTTAEQSQFADKFLGKMGFRSPNSRIVDGGSAEAQAIVNTVPAKFVVPASEQNVDEFRAKMKEKLGQVPYFKIMTFDPKPSLDDLVKEAKDDTKMGLMVAQVFGNNSVMQQLGRLVVADSFIGNDDRIGKNVANIGNVMIQNGTVSTIDSDASFSEVSKAMDGTVKIPDNFGLRNAIKMLNDIFDDPGAIFDNFVQIGLIEEKISKMAKTDTFDPVASFGQAYGPVKRTAKAAFLSGISQGELRLTNMLSTQADLTELRQEAEKPYASSAGKEKKTDWSSFEGRKIYFMKRMGGGPGATAQIAKETAEGHLALPFVRAFQFNSKGIPAPLNTHFPYYPPSAKTFRKGKEAQEAENFKVQLRAVLQQGGSTDDNIIKQYEAKLTTLPKKVVSTEKATFFVEAMRLQWLLKDKWQELGKLPGPIKDIGRAAAANPGTKGEMAMRLAQAQTMVNKFKEERDYLKLMSGHIRALLTTRKDLVKKGSFDSYFADINKWQQNFDQRVGVLDNQLQQSHATIDALQ